MYIFHINISLLILLILTLLTLFLSHKHTSRLHLTHTHTHITLSLIHTSTSPHLIHTYTRNKSLCLSHLHIMHAHTHTPLFNTGITQKMHSESWSGNRGTNTAKCDKESTESHLPKMEYWRRLCCNRTKRSCQSLPQRRWISKYQLFSGPPATLSHQSFAYIFH